jgi:hypothetical protein
MHVTVPIIVSTSSQKIARMPFNPTGLVSLCKYGIRGGSGFQSVRVSDDCRESHAVCAQE